MDHTSHIRLCQRDRLLALLVRARGAWVPLPEITACAAQYQARLLELRRLGFHISRPRIETINGQRHTWYRLESSPAQPAATEPRSAAINEPQAKPGRLFPDDAPLRHLDLG